MSESRQTTLAVLVFRKDERYGLQAVRIKKDSNGGRASAIVFKPLLDNDEVSEVRDGEVWVCDVSADPFSILADGQLILVNAIPLLPLEPLGTTLVLDLAELDTIIGGKSQKQWRARHAISRDKIAIQYVLDWSSTKKPAGPQEAGRYCCVTTKVIGSRCWLDNDGEICADVTIAVKIESKIVSPRAARRQKAGSMPVLVS